MSRNDLAQPTKKAKPRKGAPKPYVAESLSDSASISRSSSQDHRPKIIAQRMAALEPCYQAGRPGSADTLRQGIRMEHQSGSQPDNPLEDTLEESVFHREAPALAGRSTLAGQPSDRRLLLGNRRSDRPPGTLGVDTCQRDRQAGCSRTTRHCNNPGKAKAGQAEGNGLVAS
jgi:hypothetical protein